MPAGNGEAASVVRLLELIKRYTDESQPLSQRQLRALAVEKLGTDECLGYKNTFTRRLYGIADALNKDKNGECYGEDQWKIVFPGYGSPKDRTKNGKIYYRHAVTEEELEALCEVIQCSDRWTPDQRDSLTARLRGELAWENVGDDLERKCRERKAHIREYRSAAQRDVSRDLSFLQHAIAKGRKVKFDLDCVDEKGRWRTQRAGCVVTPYYIVSYGGRFFLLGLWDFSTGEKMKNTVRLFDLEYISSLRHVYTRLKNISRGKYIRFARWDAVEGIMYQDLWKKQTCYRHLGAFEERIEPIRFRVRDVNDYSFIYRTFNSECCTVKNKVFTVRCPEDFFVEWAVKYADRIIIEEDFQGAGWVKAEIRKRLEKALENL